MSITIYVRVLKSVLNKRKISSIVTRILTYMEVEGDVSVHIIGDTRMKRMNLQYRSKNQTTDVLSFPAGDLQIEGEVDLGDIFISQTQIKRQAKENDVSAKEEMTRMLAHGVLHILGYDHETKKEAEEMFSLQESFVNEYT